MRRIPPLVARAALLSAAGGLAGFAGGIAGVIWFSREIERAHRLAVTGSARLLAAAGKLAAEDDADGRR